MSDTPSTTHSPDEQRLARSVLHIARVVLEAATPLSLSTGNPDGVFDTALVTDANDLPALPGTSLAGVLRHLWRETYGKQQSDDTLFGYQKKNRGDASRLAISWGAMLDSQGRAAEGLLAIKEPQRLTDPVYADALKLLDEPVFRNRVKLSHQGAAADTGKFDRAVLPRGHRFAVELRLWSDDKDDVNWYRLLNLLAHPTLRLGGATRTGLGKLHCFSCEERSFALSDQEDTRAYKGLPDALSNTSGLNKFIPDLRTTSFITGTLRLSPRGFWRIGQRATDFRDTNQKPADLVPVTEPLIEWDNNGTPTIHEDTTHLLFPASSLKGAMAHRLNFHCCRFSAPPIWADPGLPSEDRHELVDALFGSVKTKTKGQAGNLYIDDTFLPVSENRLKDVTHNSIDRFTGGVRNRVLFSELSIHGSDAPIDIKLTLDQSRLQQSGADLQVLRDALKATLDDLCQGRLALGSRTSTGNGFFDGQLEGALKDWLESDNHNQEEAA